MFVILNIYGSLTRTYSNVPSQISAEVLRDFTPSLPPRECCDSSLHTATAVFSPLVTSSTHQRPVLSTLLLYVHLYNEIVSPRYKKLPV
jgi:hypothetical protein